MMNNFLNTMRLQTQQRLSHIPETIEQLHAVVQRARTPLNFLEIFAASLIKISEPCIIAEIKFASPAKGELRKDKNPCAIAKQYITHGASALSILTEPTYFQGSLDFLQQVRKEFPQVKLLMKDFICDERQLLQARIYGADAVLLIASFLSVAQLQTLYHKALALQLTPLIEVHTKNELLIAQAMRAPLIGINTRNLSTLEIDLTIADQLIDTTYPGIFICESGISSGKNITHLQRLGYQGFLIGSYFMQSLEPGQTLRQLMEEIKHAD